MTARRLRAAGIGLAALFAPLAPAAAQGPAPAAATAGPDQAEALALAREVVRVGYPEDKRAEMFFGAVDAMSQQMRSVSLARFNNDPTAKAIIDRNIDRFIAACKPILDRHIPDIIDGYAQAYSHEFSVAELRDLLAFVKTPTGGHFFLRNSAVLSDPAFAAANQAYIRDLEPQMDKLRESITRELAQHYMQHPPKASTGS